MDDFVTESLNPHSKEIDKNSTEVILRIINNKDKNVSQAVMKQIPQITEASKAIVTAIIAGGRVIFIGAGTSGRLGIIEATEMPPTFGVSEKIFHAIIAGGQEAVFMSKEGAEDLEPTGAKATEDLDLNYNDLIIALTASGHTPFVVGGLKKAK